MLLGGERERGAKEEVEGRDRSPSSFTTRGYAELPVEQP